MNNENIIKLIVIAMLSTLFWVTISCIGIGIYTTIKLIGGLCNG
jgi:hypothetical protein